MGLLWLSGDVKEVNQGESAIDSLKSQRKEALETSSWVLLPTVPLVVNPMGAPKEGQGCTPMRALRFVFRYDK